MTKIDNNARIQTLKRMLSVAKTLAEIEGRAGIKNPSIGFVLFFNI